MMRNVIYSSVTVLLLCSVCDAPSKAGAQRATTRVNANHLAPLFENLHFFNDSRLRTENSLGEEGQLALTASVLGNPAPVQAEPVVRPNILNSQGLAAKAWQSSKDPQPVGAFNPLDTIDRKTLRLSSWMPE